jgi:LPPG:FO 2-phospho-L-lactate transferase
MLAGLVRVVDPAELTVVVNTGDDERIQGLHVSPDIDTVLYHLAGLTDWDRGWGITGETFVANERYRALAAAAGGDVDLQEWFALGDRDLATHMLRTRLLDTGRSLTEATDALRRALGIGARVIPMSDEPIRTLIDVAGGERLSFQEYFVHRQHADEIVGISYSGVERAAAAPDVLDAVAGADVLLIPPSNPLLSVEPVLATGGIGEALSSRTARSVAVSPIVGGKALKGPADRVLASMGHDASASGVSALYRGLVDTFVIDTADREQETSIDGMDVLVTDTIMSGPESAARLCKEILAHVA